MLRHLLGKKDEGERGQSIVLIALAMVAILAIMGLVLDGGVMYFSRRNSQNASDAAAYAGTRALTVLPYPRSGNLDSTVRAAISQYVTANGVSNPSQNVAAYFIDASNNNIQPITSTPQTVPDSATGVRVQTTINVQTLFINFVSGSTQSQASTVAAAQSGKPSLTSFAPMAAPLPTGCDPDNPQTPPCWPLGQLVQLQGSKTYAGSFQWAVYNGDNTPENIAKYILGVNKAPPIPVGYCLPSVPGDKTGGTAPYNIRDALDTWLPPNLPAGAAHWIIPVFDPPEILGQCTPNGGGNNTGYYVRGFAEFIFLGYDFAGQKNLVNNYNCPTSLVPKNEQFAANGFFPSASADPATGAKGHFTAARIEPATGWNALAPAFAPSKTPKPTNTPTPTKTPTRTSTPQPPTPTPTSTPFSGKYIQGCFAKWTNAGPGTAGDCNQGSTDSCAVWLIQ